MIKNFIHQFASPKTYIYKVDRLYPYILYISLTIYLISIFWGLFLTPEDFVQGNSYRIIYLHVPASFISQSLFMAMAIASAIYLIWKVKLSVYLVRSIAPIGAVTTFIALISGSIWGIPTWGTWWVWDARITSMLILALFYAMYLISWRIYENEEKVYKISTFITILGIINVPIIKYSVDWWNTLHQPASINILSKSSIHSSMLYPLLIMTAAFALFSLLIFLMKYNTELIKIKNKGLDRL